MITKLTLRNFKSVGEQSYDFTRFDLLVGRNNSGKSTVLQAMADVSNEELTRLLASPYILYVESESDERILRAWADACGVQAAMDKICFKAMGGGGKKNMKERADAHFMALQQIVPGVARLVGNTGGQDS